ncbi:MAG: glycosyltransferase [bacterium]|nr:glycosyltransferase [bacterium]
MKLAIIHEWLTSLGGAERCLKVFTELWPDAPIFVSVYDHEKFSDWFPPEKVRSSFIQKFPNALKWYRHYLPFMPTAVESYDLRGFDVVLSSSHCAAGGVKPDPGAVHVSYIYTPMRYVWDLIDIYTSHMNPITRAVFMSQVPRLRRWDVERTKRVTHFLPISETVRERINRIYKRDGKVVYPPVRDKLFQPCKPEEKEDYFLVLSRLVSYKRIDLVVEACTRMKKRLIVAGSGGEMERLKSIAGDTVEFIGFVREEDVPSLVAKARAVLHPSLEDFGIVPGEAACAGTPTIAYGVGGASETVVDGVTGVFFMEQEVEAVIGAIDKFEKMDFDLSDLRKQGEKFSEERFRQEIWDIVNGAVRGEW